LEINNWKTKITKEHMGDSIPIALEDIDIREETQSRVKGGSFDKNKKGNSHLTKVTQSMRNRLSQNLDPIDIPIVVEDNDVINGKRFKIVLGHHRYRGFRDVGLDEIPAVVVNFDEEKEEILRRRFQKYNNDHETPAEGNSNSDVLKEIEDSINDMISEGYDIEKDKRTIRLAVTKDIKDMFGNNWTDSQIERMVGDWFENLSRDHSSDQIKFKGYGSTDAFNIAKKLLNLDNIKEPGKPQDDTPHILYAVNLSDAPLSRYWAYAYIKKLENPGACITLVCYYKTAKLDSYKDLEELREKHEDRFRKLAELEYIHGRRSVDKIYWLPQHMATPKKEPENRLIGMPWKKT